MRTVFLRALEATDKPAALAAAIRNPLEKKGPHRFEVDLESFGLLPHSAFAYWSSDEVRNLFKKFAPFESDGRAVKQGLATADDFRFLRNWWEVNEASRSDEKRWFPFAKGGSASPFYADLNLVVKWEASGLEIRNNLNERGGIRSNVWMLRDTSANFFLKPGLTYPARPSGSGWFSVVPAGCIFSHNGPMVFADESKLIGLLAVLNSRAFHYLVQLMMARGQGGSGQTLTYEVGMIARTPVPSLNKDIEMELNGFAKRAWSIARELDSCNEISHAFVLPALLQVSGATLADRANNWLQKANKARAELASLQADIDARCFDLYGMTAADRSSIMEGFGESTQGTNPDGADEDESEPIDDADGDSHQYLVAQLVSWAIGVAIGRFDIRIATDATLSRADPGLFDALPAYSPAMLTDKRGGPLDCAPSGYPIVFPKDGILVDDAGHPSDLTAAVRLVFEEVFKREADERWNEAASLLDDRGRDLRAWIRGSFFERHLRSYSRSRRKSPTIWQIGVPSGRYSVWMYAHRLDRDSFIKLQNDIVAPKLAREERLLSDLKKDAANHPATAKKEEIEAQEQAVEEIRVLLDEVKRVAPLFMPSTDDGTLLTMAPLWRLSSQHRPWQRELAKKWGELVAGKYDWSHLAMHLWPERVVPKCATDRSLAIAHGLDDLFWFEDEKGEWKAREKSKTPIAQLVSEKTSANVKEALKSLMEAPEVVGGTSRSRKSKGL
ncbi:BREX-1 system adenine-specific DNA-methyltransferase PglX [Bradyrhizobium diazoefficiens]